VSTIISLVVVGVCVVATTWLALRDGGKPATETSRGHRTADVGPASTSVVGPGGDEHTSIVREDHLLQPAANGLEATEPDTELEPEPVESAPQPDEPGAPSLVTEREATTVAEPGRRPPAAGHPAPRGSRARAPERVRARRRDHAHLGKPDPDAAVLVAPTELPRPQPAATGSFQRLRSAAGLVVMLVAFGISAAVVLGVIVVVVSDILEKAVE